MSCRAQRCPAARLCGLSVSTPTQEQLDRCGDALGLQNIVKVIPADRLWALQAWETGVYLVLAVAGFAFAVWWLRRLVAAPTTPLALSVVALRAFDEIAVGLNASPMVLYRVCY